MTKTPILKTQLARQDWGEYQFRGSRVFVDLAGKSGYWGMLSLSVGGPTLSDEDKAVLDVLCDSTVAADPRIPALKLGRLIASYGSAFAAFSSIFLPLEGGLFGPWSTYPAAKRLVEVSRAVGDDLTEQAVEAVVDQYLRDKIRMHGFGVPVRSYDARIRSLSKQLDRLGRSSGHYWQLTMLLDRIMTRRKGKGANLGSGYAAVMLDLGFTTKQIPMVSVGVVLPCISGNAFEGAEQAPDVLRDLGAEWVDYSGPAPRQSPRATASKEGGRHD